MVSRLELFEVVVTARWSSKPGGRLSGVVVRRGSTALPFAAFIGKNKLWLVRCVTAVPNQIQLSWK